MGKLFYKLVRGVLDPLVRIPYRVGLEGTPIDQIPNKVILASNHSSFYDPLFLVLGTNREIYFIMKEFPVGKKMMGDTCWGWLARRFNPVFLNGTKMNREKLEECLQVLDREEALGIFPEGGRTNTGEMGELNMGIATIAARSRSPVVPVYIEGLRNIWPRGQKYPRISGKVKLRVGEVLDFPYSDKLSRKFFMVRLRKEFERLGASF